MATMRDAFGVPVGFSDHTLGLEVSFAAVALGAKVIEKHFTLNPSDAGPDHRASLPPAELHALVRGIRSIESALGDGVKRPAEAEAGVEAVARKSVVTTRAVAAGAILEREDLAIRRPGNRAAARRARPHHRTAHRARPRRGRAGHGGSRCACVIGAGLQARAASRSLRDREPITAYFSISLPMWPRAPNLNSSSSLPEAISRRSSG